MKIRFALAATACVALVAAGCAHTNSSPPSSHTTTTTTTTTHSTPAPAPAQPAGAIPPVSAGAQAPVTTASGLTYQDFVVGTGPSPSTGKTVTVHYTGWLTNGTKFDSSRDRGTPFQFPLGRGGVIAGWDEGVAGMRVGGQRRLTIPPKIGYGASGAGGVIPPNATLIFEVELLAIRRG